MAEPRERKEKRSALANRAADLADTPGTEVAKAVKSGILERIDPNLVLDARHYFVMKLYPLSDVARTLNIPLAHVERWAMIFDWHSLRRKHEEHFYKAMGGKLAQISKTLGLRSDEIASNLEGAIEEAIRKRQEDPDNPLEAKDLGTLTRALKDLYELRRTIHGREGKVDRKIVEHTVPDDIKDILKSAKRSDPEKKIKVDVIEDAEFELD